MKKFERDELPKLDWLDTLAFRKMEEIRAVSDTFMASFYLSYTEHLSLGGDSEVGQLVPLH